MKKTSIIISAVILILATSFFIFFNIKFNEDYISESYNYEILSKKLEGAKSFDFYHNGEIYISQGDEIIKINKDNSKEEVLKKEGQNIGEVKISGEKLFFILDEKLMYYNLKTKEEKIILNNIPNYKNVEKNKLLIMDNNLFLTIDSATNAGILNEEDLSLNPNNQGEKYPINLEFNEKHTASLSEDKEVENEKKIENKVLSTASVLKIDMNTFESELFAYGIKNILGIDYDCNKKIYITVGGIEESGARPLYGDVDYIYTLTNTWYGWPDYSGGDPVNSPRFREQGKVKQGFLLKKHPNIPPAPFYQNDEINSLGRLAIDKDGVLGTKDFIIIYDKNEESLISLNKSGEKKELMKIKNSFLSDLKFYNNNFYFLDNKNGYLVEIKCNKKRMVLGSVFFILLLITLTLIIIAISFFFKLIRKK